MFFFTDWEGPWILTDFALELTMAAFNNERFFRNLSAYDDYLAYDVKREGYEAGYTMKLLAPFISAAGFRNSDLELIARQTAKFVPHAKEAMNFLKKRWTPVIISTSYMQYLKITAEMIGVSEHLHGSEVDFDAVDTGTFKDEILQSVDVIASLDGDELFSFLDEFFSRHEIWKICEKVRAVGAGEKAKIVKEYCEKHRVEFPIAIGDSISDYKMFEEVRKLGGVAIAFNGNEFAINHADVAIVSNSAAAEAAVIDLLMREGERAINNLPELRLPDELKAINPKYEVFLLDQCDKSEVVKKSSRMRVTLRGKAGLLG